MRSFDQTTSIALLNVATKMAKLNKSTLPSGEVIKRITPNYYIVNFNDVIDANILEYLLLQEFSSLHSYTDFEYGIYDCARIIGSWTHCHLIASGKLFTVKGPFPRMMVSALFGVKFPSHQEDLRANTRSSWLMALIAAITVAFFSYAIWVIFNQRRYSEMQRDFINNMTHEFKTPLTSIQLSSDFLAKQPAIEHDERLKRYTELIRSQYQRLIHRWEIANAQGRIRRFRLKRER